MASYYPSAEQVEDILRQFRQMNEEMLALRGGINQLREVAKLIYLLLERQLEPGEGNADTEFE